jgi:hypothetical protein
LADGGRRQSGVEALASERRVGLALGIDDGPDVLQELGEVFLAAFPTSGGEGIDLRTSGVEFAEPLANGDAVPAQLLFDLSLSADPKRRTVRAMNSRRAEPRREAAVS